MKLSNLQYPTCFHDTVRSQSLMHSVAIGKAAESLAFFKEKEMPFMEDLTSLDRERH